MNRRNAVLVGSLVAALAVVELVVLSGLLAAERSDDRQRYADATLRQRRAAGREQPTPAEERPRSAPQTFCVRGVDTLVATIQGSLQKDVVDGRGRLDTAVLRELSNLAIRAERYVEQATAGPALPQRMGRVRRQSPDGSNDGNDEKPSGNRAEWTPLAPPVVDCDEGQAFAAFRLPIESPPVVRNEAKEPGAGDKKAAEQPKPKKNQTARKKRRN